MAIDAIDVLTHGIEAAISIGAVIFAFGKLSGSMKTVEGRLEKQDLASEKRHNEIVARQEGLDQKVSQISERLVRVETLQDVRHPAPMSPLRGPSRPGT